ncbi:hypothetical protein [Micromonospora sp. NPDC050276]|uniref:hypothetical protein n=1 Tax=Micromonospora sp. NPDC050276 TaxID=3364278 RepID=UPI0037987DBF
MANEQLNKVASMFLGNPRAAPPRGQPTACTTLPSSSRIRETSISTTRIGAPGTGRVRARHQHPDEPVEHRRGQHQLQPAVPPLRTLERRAGRNSGPGAPDFWVRVGNATRQVHGDDLIKYQEEHWGWGIEASGEFRNVYR